MNEKVTRIVNLLFQDVAPSEEVLALRDEVLNNCQDRFADLIRSGLNEEESLAAVAESLKGMDEVLKQYPRKGEIPEEATAKEAPASEEEPGAKAPALSRFAPDQIRAIEARLTSCDLEVLQGEDAEGTLEVEGSIQMRLEEDGTLRLWQERAAEDLFRGIRWDDSLSSFEQLGNTLSQLGRNLTRVITRGLNQETQECRAVLRLPLSAHPEARIRTTSGDITWRDLIPGQDIVLQTTSGDIEMRVDREYQLPRVEISTMSGDAELELNADKLKVSSVSGDLSWRGEARTTEMTTTSGDAEIMGTLSNAVLKTTSGDLFLNLNAAGPADIRANTISGDFNLQLPREVGEVDANLDTVSGELRLRGIKLSAQAEIHLQVRTTSGDLKIYT